MKSSLVIGEAYLVHGFERFTCHVSRSTRQE